MLAITTFHCLWWLDIYEILAFVAEQWAPKLSAYLTAFREVGFAQCITGSMEKSSMCN